MSNSIATFNNIQIFFLFQNSFINYITFWLCFIALNCYLKLRFFFLSVHFFKAVVIVQTHFVSFFSFLAWNFLNSKMKTQYSIAFCLFYRYKTVNNNLSLCHIIVFFLSYAPCNISNSVAWYLIDYCSIFIL